MNEDKQAATLQNVAGSKLLNFTTKDMLKQFMTPVKYAEVEQQTTTNTEQRAHQSERDQAVPVNPRRLPGLTESQSNWSPSVWQV